MTKEITLLLLRCLCFLIGSIKQDNIPEFE